MTSRVVPAHDSRSVGRRRLDPAWASVRCAFGRSLRIGLCLLWLCSAVAIAQASSSDQVARPEVRELVIQSSTHFQRGDYDAALTALLKAYELQPLPLLLFNIAQAYRKAGKREEALRYYERFVATAPQSPLTPEAEAHSAALRAEFAAERAARDRADAEKLSEQARVRLNEAEAMAAKNEAARQQAQADMLLLERRAAQIADKKPIYRRPWFWGLLGGLAAAGLATGLGVGLAMRPPDEPVTDLPGQTIRF